MKQGCILSPLLFNIYLSDLPKILDNDLNLTNPNSVHPSCLIWADDIVLFSLNEEGLNRMLKSIEKYCEDNELVLNKDKTKCLIFNKTGRLIRKYFYFNNTKLETVRSFKYLGFLLTPSGEIKSGLEDLRDRAMKAFFKLKNSMGTSFHIHIETTLHMLDTLIKPILLYAADFWGCLKPPKDNPIERFHHMACKHILGVQKQTTNVGVLLELGRIPLQIYAVKTSIKNWERIKSSQLNEHLQTSYTRAMTYNLPWVATIRDLLHTNGLASFYTNRFEGKPPFIHKRIYQILSDNFHQNTFSTIGNPESKLRTYGLLKTQIGFEKYLRQITNPTVRQSRTKLRLSNHTLNIEVGRHNKIPKELRFCPFCPNSVESEVHFIVECHTYNTLREKVWDKLICSRPNFIYYTPTQKFKFMLSEENIQHTSHFIHRCFEIRKFIIARHKRPF